MSFLYPQWFWLIILILVLIFERSSHSKLRREHFLIIASLVMIMVALSRPVLPKEPIERDVKGDDIIVAVDLSYSMSATDIKPSRLEKAKELLKELVTKQSDDRFGVIGFTTNAIILSPMTNDSELLLHLFSALDEKMIITKSTQLMSALELSSKMSHSKETKILILTDGGDNDSYEKEHRYAKEHSLKVSVMMIATNEGSTLLDQYGEILKDEDGNIAITSKNEAIADVADGSGGVYIDDLDVDKFISYLKENKDEKYSSKTKIMQYVELFYIFIALSIIFFLMAVTNITDKLIKLFTPILLLFGVNSQANMLEYYHLQSALTAYEKEDFINSASHFEHIDSNRAKYNSANGYYRAGEYEKAVGILKSIKSTDANFKADIFYNISCGYIRLKEFESAREYMIKSLSLRYDENAVENLAFIEKAQEQDFMLTGRQKAKKREESQNEESSSESKNKKSGGGSNMNVDTSSSNKSSSNDGKKTKSESQIDFKSSPSQLSSKQYELINKGEVDEARPW